MKRIDRKMAPGYRLLVALQLGTLALMGNVAIAQDISSPESLTYEIYSSSTAELFWIRSSTLGMNYEITRNGQLLDSTSGVSYVDKSLTRGSTYAYDIVAIDPAGSRSDVATVSFSIGGNNESQTVLQPSGLRADVYSSRSAELFWDRPLEIGLTYDVSQDGSLLETTNGVSFYAKNLSPGVEQIFQVVAVDVEGNRSLPSSVSFTTTGSSRPQDDDPQGDLAAEPTGLRASIYSSRFVELFWDRPATTGLTFEIQRDGAVLDTIAGVSFYDKNLSAGNMYTFQIVAIDTLGNRSAASSIVVSTPVGSVPVTPSPTNHTTATAIQEPEGFFDEDGYSIVDVVRLDVRTVTMLGICTNDDESGCTLDDVKGDIDGNDDFTVDIPIHFHAADLANDGSINNAELRQRGGFTRLATQKSFRVKLDSKEELWRGERRLQLNKMPYDQSRIRNKLSFDLMQDIPHLPSLRTQFVNLWIDDGNGPEDYGLYTHAEYVGKEYLVNRERDTDDKIYKIEEFVFALSDLEYLALDSDGEPLDDNRFETRLDIKSGDDHRKMIEMINAVNDNARSFDSILGQYFDKDNVLAWVTVNFLLHQMDAVTHNFYLYNPVGSDKFYFMPWDYDGTFSVEQKPANSLETSELLRRLYYGFSKGRASNFLNRYYRQPGIYEEIVARASELRNSYLTDSAIAALASEYSRVISTYAGRTPDIDYNAAFAESNSSGFSGFVADNHAALLNYGIPFPPKLRSIEPAGDLITFEWGGAHDMKGQSIAYELEISSSPDFGFDDRLLFADDLLETDGAGYDIDAARIGSGERYARLIARSSANPDENWQAASNRPTIDGQMRVGVMQFTAP
jgi:spore coat protein CotH/fibronectin type 3 domain-containing protein